MAEIQSLLPDAASAPVASIGSMAPFRYPIFRNLWIANTTSTLGALVQNVASAWLMTELTPSHELLALVQSSSLVPIMTFGIFAGAIADNFDRRVVLLAAQTGMFLAAALLTGLSFAGIVTPFVLIAVTFIGGIATSINTPAWQASMRQIVGLEMLPQAIALNSISFNVGRSIGPALGGLIILLWSVSGAFLINTISFTGLLWVLWRWQPAERMVTRHAILPAIAQGIRYCATTEALRNVLLRGFLLGFGISGFQALLPAVARNQLHGTGLDFGLMLGLFGIGSISTAFYFGRLRSLVGIETLFALGTLGYCGAELVLASSHSMLPILGATFVGGVSWVLTLTSINVAMQTRSPDRLLGRCLSLFQAVTFGGMAIGAWIWGALADLRNVPLALDAGAIFLGLSLLARFVAPLPGPNSGRLHI